MIARQVSPPSSVLLLFSLVAALAAIGCKEQNGLGQKDLGADAARYDGQKPGDDLGGGSDAASPDLVAAGQDLSGAGGDDLATAATNDLVGIEADLLPTGDLVIGGGCPAATGGQFYVDAIAGSAVGASPAPTGALSPSSCRFKTLRDALAVAGSYASTNATTAKVIATGASGTMTFDEVEGGTKTKLVVPANVELTAADATSYELVLDDTSHALSPLMTLADGSTLRNWRVKSTDSYGVLIATSGSVGMHQLDLSGSQLHGVEILAGGTVVATNIKSHNHSGYAFYVDQTATALDLSSSQLLDNAPVGGGVVAYGGMVTIDGTYLDGNHMGLDIRGATVDVSGGTEIANSTHSGIWAQRGALTITGTAIAPIRVHHSAVYGIHVGNRLSAEALTLTASFLSVSNIFCTGLYVDNGLPGDNVPRTVSITSSLFDSNGDPSIPNGYCLGYEPHANLTIFGAPGPATAPAQNAYPTSITNSAFVGADYGVFLEPMNRTAWAVKLTGNSIFAAKKAGLQYLDVDWADTKVAPGSDTSHFLWLDGNYLHDNLADGLIFDSVPPQALHFQNNRVASNAAHQVRVTDAAWEGGSPQIQTTWNLGGGACESANTFACLGTGRALYVFDYASAGHVHVDATNNAWPHDPPSTGTTGDADGAGTITPSCPAVTTCPLP